MRRIVLFLLLGVLCGNEIIAQQLNQVQRGQRGYVPQMRLNEDTYIDLVDPYAEVDKMMPRCVTELNLDAFEQEIMKAMLLKKFESSNAILSDEKNLRADRKKKLDALNKEFLKELRTILSSEEVDIFNAIDFSESKIEKKRRKKKKKNKRN